MKWVLVGAWLVIGIAGIYATAGAGERCRVGSKWSSPCFDCACLEEGKSVCKRKSTTCDDAAAAIEVWECEPRTSWKNDCNWCHCSDNGRPLCTKRGCEPPLLSQTPPIQEPTTATELPLGRNCLPGTKWNGLCGNVCHCGTSGLGFCTLVGCKDYETRSELECKPDTVWRKDDCNTCRCTDGKSVCTKKACKGLDDNATEPTVSVPSTSPQPTPTAAPAVDEATTAAAAEAASPVGRECAIGTRWESQCGNTCFCGPNGYGACTEKGCEGYDAAKDFKCKPDSTWTDECNTCFCTKDGKPACTRVGCDSTAIKIPELNFEGGDKEVSGSTEANILKRRLQKRDTCTPGETYKQDCNTCLCTSGGVLACTRKGCVHAPSDSVAPDTANRRLQKRDTCTPGETFKQDCNTCHCTDDGRAVCTKKGCIHVLLESSTPNSAVQAYSDRLKREVCKPNEVFQNECNVCTCNEEGISYKCTQNECMSRAGSKSDGDVEVFMENEGTDHIERHSVCQPSSTFQINCHTCQCNEDGTDYRCTDEPCPLPDDVELFKELKDETHIVPLKRCDPNGYFYDECNKCRCNKDGTDYKCSKTACNGNPTEESKKQEAKSSRNKSIVCQANKAFQKDCNTCWCNDDGTGYFCTRKVCVPNQPDDADTPEELRIIEKECRPHEVFEVECNMCRCNEDGKSFSCTRRACVTDAPTDAVDFEPKLQNPEAEVADKPASTARARVKRQEKPQTSPTKKCEPNAKFRLDCNTCLCDNEGANFSCTRINCNNGSANNAKRRRREVRSQKKECEPGSVFSQACNVCRCASDGQHATCTNNRCPTRQDTDDKQVSTTETGFRCTPGEQFKRFCNDCTCSADGKSVFCTIKLCENEIVSQL